MPDEKVFRENERQLVSAKAALAQALSSYTIALQTAYQKPDRAEMAIHDYASRNGMKGLRQQLEEDPEYFGKRQGHALTPDGWRENAPGREAWAREALETLADKAEAVVKSSERVKSLEQALDPQIAQQLRKQRERGGPERS